MANCFLCGRSDRDGLVDIRFEVQNKRFECVDDWDCDSEIESKSEMYPQDIDDTPSLGEMPSYAN